MCFHSVLTVVRKFIRLGILLFTLLLQVTHGHAQKAYPLTGSIERYDSAINAILSPAAKAEIIATGFDWSEGPLWIESAGILLFSDVPRNTIYKWTEAKGTEVYLSPSGYTGNAKRGGETGSNGLTLDQDGRLVLCQHGDRRMARMDAPIHLPQPRFITLAGTFQGKKFNSPNDAVYNSKGELFFTDPPYGLEKYIHDPAKEIPFQGVYKRTAKGEVVLLTDTLTRPNGVAFLPGEKTLLVANSDGAKPNWYAIDFAKDGTVSNVRIFYSAAGYDKSLKGGNDGLKVDRNGNVFATGPGGIWIFTKEAKLLGKIRLDEAASNCALSPDEKTLYITNDMQVLRVKLR
ncbi:MAG TPA: SMP-30/gluconolactonase/LRE family protein [Flavisolibacter sp.]|nr:SMP-30/gluconolactonase/LRE family protein [Flavisolibacter sp.]